MKTFCLLYLTFFCSFYTFSQNIVLSEDLEINHINERILIHTSYASMEPYGRFGSNGLIFVNDNKAIIMDTPITLETSETLLTWLDSMEIEVQAVIINHFHQDCLGGLPVFHERSIPSYANELTIVLATMDSVETPTHGFKDSVILSIDNLIIEAKFWGEAHSKDNIIVWVPSEKTVFGGCMIKSLNSGRGNLGDANVSAWSKTVTKIKEYYDAEIVVPGHGKHGNEALFDYTIEMFRND